MRDRRKLAWAAIFISNVLIHSVVIANPIYVPQFVSGSTGRNIRHLPCVSRRSGETGVCMFAFTCAKANGTHLGTCIDRFYFGSCCKIDDEPDIFPQDNSIDDGPSPPRPFVTTHGPIESNDIPEYFARPKPTGDEKKPAVAPQTTTTPVVSGTQSTQTSSANTLRDTTKFVTKKPTITTIETTTQTTRLSTFQTVQSGTDSGSSTETASLKNATGTVNTSSSTTRQPTKPPTLSSLRPSVENVTKVATTTTTTTVQKVTTKRPVSTTTVRRPITTQTSQKPASSTTHRPIQSTTTKTTVLTTHKAVPSTRFPPRNSTTTKPTLTQTTTRKPVSVTKRPTTVITKRPAATTKKPTTLTKRPSNVTSSSFGTTLSATTKPSSTFGSFSSVGLFNTSVTENVLASEETRSPIAATSGEQTITTKNPHQDASTTKTTTRSTIRTTTSRSPTTAKVTTTTSRTTTSRPLQPTTTRSKPTKVTSTPEYITTTTERTRPLSSTVETGPTTKPMKPLTKLPMNTSSIVEVTTSISSLISMVTVRNESTSTHVPPTTKGQDVNHTLEESPVTTHSPGLVTWSSNSDEVSTKASESFSSTSASTRPTSSEQAETDWSPIITPDGWIMIQSPTTEKLPQKSTTEPVAESTPIESLTSAKPATENTTDYGTQKPTRSTTPLPIAGVTIDPKFPVPMETVNMSDYKQVCGRRLFPQPNYREAKIVGGNRSSFGKWPWQISLRQWKLQTYLHKCGAALLNENWAITAAHCIDSVPLSDLLLRFGEHNLASEDEPYGYQERRVQIVAVHPSFDARTFEYDLALMRFHEPIVPFQPNILPVCLPDDDETYVGSTAYVTGWGRLYDEGPLPSVLQEVSVSVINNTACEDMYRTAGYTEFIPHIFICAGERAGGHDSCEGDSGGPMVIQRPRDNRWILAGIISWGIGCAVPNQPGVYTRISKFREWINQILQF